MLYQLLVVWALGCGVSADILAGAPTDSYRSCIDTPPRRRDGYVSVADEQHDWHCIERSYQWNAERHGHKRDRTANQTAYLRTIFRAVAANNDCQPKLVRKEYRMMTDAERATYHRAVNTLKITPGSGPGNYYDAIASLHVGNPGAHGGPAFFNWHRIYLQMYEEALRQHEPDCILPYWASSWDNEMTTPTASIMWDARFAGNGFGAVTCGPVANWPSPVMVLTRNIGGSGGLITQQDINNVMSQNALVQISDGLSAPQNNLELHHGKVHGWVGGMMSQLNTASYDFVFFMHHAFIDCIYEQFRLRQIANGIDPDTDWPRTTPVAHAPGYPISLMPTLTNIEVSQRKHACALYEPVCTQLLYCDCNVRCPSKYLTCDRERSICIPIEGQSCDGGSGTCCGQSSGYSYGGGSNGGGRYTPYGGREPYRPQGNRYSPAGQYGPNSNNAIQNSYCIDERRCGTNYWAYVPVQINSYRPPNRNTYNSYPVVNGVPQRNYDIYDGRGYSPNSVYYQNQQAQSPAPAYQNCACRSNTGGVYIQSYGNSYEGNYREYQPTDMRQPIASTTAYVAVMNPRYGNSDSYVRVYDECGRMCRPRCRYTGSNRYVDCDGILSVTREGSGTERPTYAETYEEATELLYSYEDRGGGRRTPTYSPGNINIIYDCDYRGGWPWARNEPQRYNLTGYVGDPTYRPPVYNDPPEYIPRPQGGYY